MRGWSSRGPLASHALAPLSISQREHELRIALDRGVVRGDVQPAEELHASGLLARGEGHQLVGEACHQSEELHTWMRAVTARA